jgi:hypothetical protein
MQGHQVTAQKPHTAAWMGGAVLTTAMIGTAELLRHGAGTHGIGTALRLTARWAYCFFWPAYAGGALTATFGPFFRPLARRARELGLAFAAAQSVHLLLVAWLYAISPTPPLSHALALFFLIAAAFMYILALCSIPTLAARLPPPLWRALRIVAMEYIALAFLLDFTRHPLALQPRHLIEYTPFALLGLGALLLRLVGYAKAIAKATSTRNERADAA